jgi:hypothetical protein
MFRAPLSPLRRLRVSAASATIRRRGMLARWSLLGLLGLALVNPTWAGTLQCTTYEEKTLQRWHTICDDGTRAVSRYNRSLDRWETTITTSPPGRRTCTARADPYMNTVDVHCR